MPSPDFDVSYIDGLPKRPAGRGRLVLGKAACKTPGQPVLLFVHGGYHGAWCFSNYLRYFDAVAIPAAALDLRGHGGLPQDPDLHLQGVRDMAEDVAAACSKLDGPPVPIGHSVGALVAAAAGELTGFYGFGLLAPSPPGQLEGLTTLPLLPEGRLIAPPDPKTCREKFFGGLAPDDMRDFTRYLCPESPALLNQRYALKIHIDAHAFGMPAICLSGERDRGPLHPDGQDEAVARFFGAEYHELADAPHNMMLSADWRESARLIDLWYRQIAGT